MSFRITTNGMFYNYRRNLSHSTKNLNDTMTRLQTQRNFNSYAEDPAAANRAFQARRNYWNTGNQIGNSKYLLSKFQSGWDALDGIVDGNSDHPGLDGIIASLQGITGTAGGSRTVLGQTLISTAEAIMSAMNVRYGDEYVFAGADGLNVPFTWRTEADGSKTLLYRGIDVNTPDPKRAAEMLGLDAADLALDPPLTEDAFNALDGDYDSLTGFDGGDYDDYVAWYADQNGIDVDKANDLVEYYDTVSDYNKLQEMNNETTLVDIGLGFLLQEDGTINPATAYNSALSGIQILGFGVDEDGDALNIVSLMQELGEIFNRCDPETGDYAEDGDAERAEVLVGKLRSAIGRVQEQHVILDGKSDYLNKNLDQLEDNKLNLNEDIENIETIDMAKAIEDMMWAQYSYNAALRIGTQVLSQSLFDYFG